MSAVAFTVIPTTASRSSICRAYDLRKTSSPSTLARVMNISSHSGFFLPWQLLKKPVLGNPQPLRGNFAPTAQILNAYEHTHKIATKILANQAHKVSSWRSKMDLPYNGRKRQLICIAPTGLKLLCSSSKVLPRSKTTKRTVSCLSAMATRLISIVRRV